MYLQLIAILDTKVEEAVRRFSQLPYQTTLFNYNLHHQVAEFGRMFLKTYIDLLTTIQLIPGEFNTYYKKQLIIHHKIDAIDNAAIDDDLRKAIIQALAAPSATYYLQGTARTFPIYHRYNTPSEMLLITGVTINENRSSDAVSILHQLGMPVSMLEFSAKAGYLIPLLAEYQRKPNSAVTYLASKYGKSYKQLQKDCRLYFGATFHSFFIKIKMLDVLNDLMFTDLSLKEIALRNDFPDYSNMHRLFNKQYHFPLHTIPRFLELI